MNEELLAAAGKLINDMLVVKTGETVVITMDYGSTVSVGDAIAEAVSRAGAIPMIIKFPTPRGVGKAADPDLPVDALSAALCVCDVWIEINRQWLLYSTPFANASRNNLKLRYICLDDLTEGLLLRTVGKVDTPKLQVFMRRVAELNREAKTMRVTTPAGTDVHFEMDPIHLVACDCGDASVPGVHMMQGQLNVVPKFGSIYGKIVFDGSVTPPFARIVKEPITLTVDAGIIVKVEGGEEAAEYNKWLHSFNDPGMLKMAHIAYGFNPGAELTGLVVEDERVWGCTEWGIGYVSEIDAPPCGQDAASHTDGICLNSSVWLDDRQIMDNGHICDPELLELSPVK